MALTITDSLMESEATQHKAERSGVDWYVTWLPDRPLDRNQAITAMGMAEEVAMRRGQSPSWKRHGLPYQSWLLIVGWAGELGLTPGEAMELLNAAREE